ncbi:MAG: hypothetical protein RB292_01745 [Patescibacteria group bacterium]|jgi:uncharacterized membrane protein (GlpM family)|nr:hypothetical protein [Patescibacteria group bacterium]
MDILLKSVISGLVTAVILFIAKFSGPKLAGAIGGIPIVFAVSYILLTLNDKTVARNFLIGGVYGAIAAIFFSVALIILNSQFRTHWLNFTVAYVLCFFFALLMVYLTSK